MKRPVMLLAFILFLLPFVLIIYRVVWIGYPLLPAASGKTWQLVVDAHIESVDSQTKVAIALPIERPVYIITEERISSGNYTFTMVSEGPNRIGVWSTSNNQGNAEISYRATILSQYSGHPIQIPPLSFEYPRAVENEDRALLERLSKWKKLPLTDRFSAITGALKGNWGHFIPDEQDLKKWKEFQLSHGEFDAALLLLRESGLFAQPVEGIKMVEGIQTIPFKWIEVWTGRSWVSRQPATGIIYRKPGTLLPFVIGDVPLASISGGKLSDIRWIVTKNVISQWRFLYERTMRSARFIDKFSLFHLPDEF